VAIDNTAEILATYTTQELEELLQFIETKEGRFKNLKRQLKDELAFRLRFHLQFCLQH
jgi:NTP pyrophosphatase (non-canonical NTP hydrolase)